MARHNTDEDWEREAKLDRSFEQEPRFRPNRRRRFEIGGRTRTALVASTHAPDGES